MTNGTKWFSRSACECCAAIRRSESTALSRTTVSSTVARLSRGGCNEGSTLDLVGMTGVACQFCSLHQGSQCMFKIKSFHLKRWKTNINIQSKVLARQLCKRTARHCCGCKSWMVCMDGHRWLSMSHINFLPPTAAGGQKCGHPTWKSWQTPGFSHNNFRP